MAESYLLLEDGGRLLKEDGEPIVLQGHDDDEEGDDA